MYSYRIVKYDYSNLEQLKNEWTSFSDIGKSVSLEEYLATEKQYIDVVLYISNQLGIKEYFIKSIEYSSNELHSVYTEGQLIKIDKLSSIMKHILREKIWCKLVFEKNEIHFGYDYYMYFVSEKALKIDTKLFSLNISEFKSPYLEE